MNQKILVIFERTHAYWCVTLIITALAVFQQPIHAQFGMVAGGSSIAGKITQNNQIVKSGFSPEVDFSMNFFFDDGVAFGFVVDCDGRLINTKNIDFFEKKYKFVFDLYAGPSVLIGEPDMGIVVSAMIGYSFSAIISWAGSDAVNMGALTFKLSADLLLENFSIGVFYRPESQLIKEKSFAEHYGWQGFIDGFVVEPAWGIRLGYRFDMDL